MAKRGWPDLADDGLERIPLKELKSFVMEYLHEYKRLASKKKTKFYEHYPYLVRIIYSTKKGVMVQFIPPQSKGTADHEFEFIVILKAIIIHIDKATVNLTEKARIRNRDLNTGVHTQIFGSNDKKNFRSNDALDYAKMDYDEDIKGGF
jgi:hypothetical protein